MRLERDLVQPARGIRAFRPRDDLDAGRRILLRRFDLRQVEPETRVAADLAEALSRRPGEAVRLVLPDLAVQLGHVSVLRPGRERPIELEADSTPAMGGRHADVSSGDVRRGVPAGQRDARADVLASSVASSQTVSAAWRRQSMYPSGASVRADAAFIVACQRPKARPP